MDSKSDSMLTQLGVYGFDGVEPVILASLVTEDPLLLIGASGTGKTFLLNSLSEALGLEHRHYNASLISFDDLVGFPYPDSEHTSVKFLETPATVWQAQSVLIDEISRCKPEHQNRLFSLIHERRVQGLPLTKLRYRWAAMNPCNTDQTSFDEYSGSEPLDPALADRFALFVTASDWNQLTEPEQFGIADPSGEGLVSHDVVGLKAKVKTWRMRFVEQLVHCPLEIVWYVTIAASLLNNADIRVSPRRTRLMARSLLAAQIVQGSVSEELYRQVLSCSLPHATWGEYVSEEIIEATHRGAWDGAMLSEMINAEKRWVHAFHLRKKLVDKLNLLIKGCPSHDAGTQAVEQFLANEDESRVGAFAFVTFPAAVAGLLMIGSEAINDLGKIAEPILTVDGTISWRQSTRNPATHHPGMVRYTQIIGRLTGARRQRAQQFFNWCLVARVEVEDPKLLESEIEACASILAQRLGKTRTAYSGTR